MEWIMRTALGEGLLQLSYLCERVWIHLGEFNYVMAPARNRDTSPFLSSSLHIAIYLAHEVVWMSSGYVQINQIFLVFHILSHDGGCSLPHASDHTSNHAHIALQVHTSDFTG